MKCLQCGGRMRTRRENHRYDACGLPGVTLIGVEVRRCRTCGETEVTIPDLDGLHRALARVVVDKRERLTPAEIRFLRKYLGFSGVDFAAHMGVTAETVSRWEQGATPMGATADRLLRWMVLTREPLSHYPLDLFRNVARGTPRSIRVGLKAQRGQWHRVRLEAA